ncbi:hypothetical protein BGZ98_002121 [Dissophora globulifera]|nr:hypothetical protein BGZ98_002121 [Dissophora globulifera]
MVVSATSFEAALELVQSLQASSGPAISDRPSIQIERVFLIGGSQLYSEGIESKECKYIFLTRIHATVECDAFFPEINGSEYTLLSAEEARSVLEEYTQLILETTAVEEGRYSYEYTVYRRN